MPAAIVTGSSRGMGRAIAIRLAADGFDVMVTDIASQNDAMKEVVQTIRANGHKADCFIADVTKKVEVDNLVQEAVSKFGELKVMVANAGIAGTPQATPLLELTVEQFDFMHAVNVRGVFLCYTAAARQMIKQGKGGKIIGAASISAYRPSGNAPAYSANKWAVRGLTQVSAIELGKYGITVNAYCPGPIKTNVWNQIGSRILADKKGSNLQQIFDDGIKDRSLLKKEQMPENIAGLVSFLAGKDSDFMTGQSVISDGGIAFS